MSSLMVLTSQAATELINKGIQCGVLSSLCTQVRAKEAKLANHCLKGHFATMSFLPEY